jgi:hypothetical protein
MREASISDKASTGSCTSKGSLQLRSRITAPKKGCRVEAPIESRWGPERRVRRQPMNRFADSPHALQSGRLRGVSCRPRPRMPLTGRSPPRLDIRMPSPEEVGIGCLDESVTLDGRNEPLLSNPEQLARRQGAQVMQKPSASVLACSARNSNASLHTLTAAAQDALDQARADADGLRQLLALVTMAAATGEVHERELAFLQRRDASADCCQIPTNLTGSSRGHTGTSRSADPGYETQKIQPAGRGVGTEATGSAVGCVGELKGQEMSPGGGARRHGHLRWSVGWQPGDWSGLRRKGRLPAGHYGV